MFTKLCVGCQIWGTCDFLQGWYSTSTTITSSKTTANSNWSSFWRSQLSTHQYRHSTILASFIANSTPASLFNRVIPAPSTCSNCASCLSSLWTLPRHYSDLWWLLLTPAGPPEVILWPGLVANQNPVFHILQTCADLWATWVGRHYFGVCQPWFPALGQILMFYFPTRAILPASIVFLPRSETHFIISGGILMPIS